jgi:hypothetical protein
MFRLLEPSNDLTNPNTPRINILGREWALNEYEQVSEAPNYTCISYAWGKERIDNPLCNEHTMSKRTLRAVETAMRVSQSPVNWANNINFSHGHDTRKEAVGLAAAVAASQAFWVDALCVPTSEPARTECLQTMGKVFSSSYQVIVVLTQQCSEAIQHTLENGKLSATDLLVIEGEDWISRAWTYQETVNSQRLYFAVEGNEKAIISGNGFLNSIMVAIDEYKLSKSIDKVAWEEYHPRLRSLERLLADYLVSDFTKRSAYQVMSVMEGRISERPEDHFYAMIGAITTKALQDFNDRIVHPSEYFMRVCEEKSDFSFLYSTGMRNKKTGRRWRPLKGKSSAILPDLFTLGSGESGHIEHTYLQLNNMYHLALGSILFDGLKAARWFVGDKNETNSPDNVAAQVLNRLRILGFRGCDEYLEFETGFFFPQSEYFHYDDLFVVVSHNVHWVTGGPGLLLRANNSDINDFCDVGVFVGRRPTSGEEVKVG